MNQRREGFHESALASATPSERLILFTRFPVAGRAKTRLIPALGEQGAVQLQLRLTLRALRAAEAIHLSRGVELEIQFDGAERSAMEHWLGDRFVFTPQAKGDLGQRMAEAFGQAFQQGARAVVLMGADCPQLTSDTLAEAFARLSQSAVVLGPAKDGGYYLVGLRRPIPQLFTGVPWGTGSVLADSLRILAREGLQASLLEPLDDIDRPADLAVWKEIVKPDEVDLTRISVIIPALNEAAGISCTVASAASGGASEVLVVDGGSTDGTPDQAVAAGAVVINSRPGRARQMNAGASRASGNVFLFLHADTSLPQNYAPLLGPCLAQPNLVAGAFRFSVRERFAGRSLLEWTTNFRSRWLQMPYGDQAIFLRRSLFEELGGFMDLPILEDYELGQRLRRQGRIATLPVPVSTSARRWQSLGFWRATWINKRVLLGYRLGTPINKLAEIYRRIGS